MSIRFITSTYTYEIQETLGESPFSLVYLAKRADKELKIKMPIVIKVFKESKSRLASLQMESVLRARHSPHLVKALSFEKFNSRHALILEYISGVNLKDLIKNGALSKNEIACICSEVLKGLKELKQNGLSHGDISLSNILVDTSGSVYLTDYGLGNYKEGLTYSTKPFTAPELYKAKSAGFLSDLFSLGVLEKVLSGKVYDLSLFKTSHFIHKGDPLLDPSPENRKEKNFSFSPTALSSLGKKSQQVLFIKNCFSLKKKDLEPSFRKKKRGFHRSFINLVFFFTLLFAVNPFTSYSKDKPLNQNAEVLIRTKKWVYVKMSGFKGYPPLNIRVKRPGFYKLNWQSQKKAGVKYIYLSGGQKMVLRDKDFF